MSKFSKKEVKILRMVFVSMGRYVWTLYHIVLQHHVHHRALVELLQEKGVVAECEFNTKKSRRIEELLRALEKGNKSSDAVASEFMEDLRDDELLKWVDRDLSELRGGA